MRHVFRATKIMEGSNMAWKLEIHFSNGSSESPRPQNKHVMSFLPIVTLYRPHMFIFVHFATA